MHNIPELPPRLLEDKSVEAIPEFAHLIQQEDRVITLGGNKEILEKIGSFYLSIGNTFLDIFCASGNNIAQLLPVFQRALKLLQESGASYLQVLYQCAIALHHIGEKNLSHEFLEYAYNYYKKYPQINNEDKYNTPLIWAINAFWPDHSGGAYRITAIPLFTEFAENLCRKSGTSAETEFWDNIYAQLPDQIIIRPLHVHARIKVAEKYIGQGDFSKAIEILNTALTCFEKSGLKLSDYKHFADQISCILDFQKNSEKDGSTLAALNFVNALNTKDCDVYISNLKDENILFNEKLFAALLLSRNADLLVAGSDSIEDLQRALKYWSLTDSYLSPSKRVVMKYKSALVNLDLNQDREAAAAFIEALKEQSKLGKRGLRYLIMAQADVRRYHPFFRTNSKILEIYREWYDECINAHKSGYEINQERYHQLINSLKLNFSDLACHFAGQSLDKSHIEGIPAI